MADLFTGARLKIERANHHIADLEKQLIAFTRQNLDALIRDSNNEGQSITIIALDPPPEIALTIGDAIHNLWTALDHLTWELIGIFRIRQDRHLKFPTGDNRTNFEASCKGIVTPPKAVIKFLQSLEVFPGGAGHFHYAIHDLDNADKHKILTPVIHAPTLDELVVVSDGGKVRRRLSDLYGSSIALMPGESSTIDPGLSDISIAFEDDAEISPHIFFGNVKFVENKKVLPTILQFRDAVSHVIDTAAKFVSRN